MNKRICIVMSTYNKNITSKMCNRAKTELKNSGYKTIRTIEVPGSFEVPVMISKNINKYDGFIAIGCIIKGETANFDLISSAITNAIMNLSINYKKPIGNSIITLFNKKQALKRFDRGKEAARAVIEVLKIK